jgi:hypothetical protein
MKSTWSLPTDFSISGLRAAYRTERVFSEIGAAEHICEVAGFQKIPVECAAE